MLAKLPYYNNIEDYFSSDHDANFSVSKQRKKRCFFTPSRGALDENRIYETVGSGARTIRVGEYCINTIITQPATK